MAVDAFLTHYFSRHPVNATFTGVHSEDGRLPDWTAAARARERDALTALRNTLAHEATSRALGNNPESIDAMHRDSILLDIGLAVSAIDVWLAEDAHDHFTDKNPALWTGEAIFGAVSLMIRPFASAEERVPALTARLQAVPAFLTDMRARLASALPALYVERAIRECRAAVQLFSDGLSTWTSGADGPASPPASLFTAATAACDAFSECAHWLAERPAAPESAYSAGTALFETLLERGHWCDTPIADLLKRAQLELSQARAKLAAQLEEQFGGDIAATGEQRDSALVDALHHALAADRPTVDGYLPAFEQRWQECRAVAQTHDLVHWPDWPIRYVPIPTWAREAAPQLYWLFYRSPAPFDPYTVYDYVVTPIDASQSSDEQERRLRTWNHSTITLNHVVHHGALGHHVQNWHAAHGGRSRIGAIAATDCASRIGLFLGGTMAEGWACYATELMDELGFLTPLEQLAEQQSRVRMLARAVVDMQLHTGAWTLEDATAFYTTTVRMSRSQATAEAVKNSMFPATALMYWLGTRTILDARGDEQQRRGPEFSMRTFHDALLSHGAIPVTLAVRLLSTDRS